MLIHLFIVMRELFAIAQCSFLLILPSKRDEIRGRTRDPNRAKLFRDIQILHTSAQIGNHPTSGLSERISVRKLLSHSGVRSASRALLMLGTDVREPVRIAMQFADLFILLSHGDARYRTVTE